VRTLLAMRVKCYDELPFGFSWVIREPMLRASHALAHDGRVWLVDPVDLPEPLERAAALGEPAGVIQLLDRHPRGAAAIAARLGVPHLRLPDALPGTPFEVIRVVDVPKWREIALWWPEREALVVADAVGTAPAYRAGSAPVGVHAFLRPFPPGALRGRRPRHLLVGHGSGLSGDTVADDLETALARSRREIPALLRKLPSLRR
jgi:hypothetical protein